LPHPPHPPHLPRPCTHFSVFYFSFFTRCVSLQPINAMKTILKWTAFAVLAFTSLIAAYSVWAFNSVDTQTMPLNHGKVDAKLFITKDGLPPAAGFPKRPLIVGLGGAEGGNAWMRNRWRPLREQFMDDGYAFLALGYFGAPGTPEQLDRIALEGVYAAIMRAASDPAIDSRCIAVMGGSKGAELALALASRYPDIKAVVALAPGNAVFVGLTQALNTSSFSHNGESLPFVPFTLKATLPMLQGDKRRAFDLMMEDREAVERALIPVEKINGPILLMSGKQDEMWAATEMSDAMIARLKAKQFAHAHEHLAFDGDHAEPTKHMDKVRTFLNTHFKPGVANGCGRG
jgi:pimeloyl-ACP methyl ester carboxylesterase